MANYKINPTCGHQYDVQLFGKGDERHRKIEYFETGICPTCWKKQQEEKRAKESQENQSAGLPKLTGSPKQISWAESIRAKYNTQWQSLKINLLKNIDKSPDLGCRILEIAESIINNSDSKFWIDNRDAYSNFQYWIQKEAQKYFSLMSSKPKIQ